MSVQITFGANANRDVVSDLTTTILTDILNDANLTSCRITSTSRTPADQARIMYHNIVDFGVTAQKKLYAAAGDKVIDEYLRVRNQGGSPSEIIEVMRIKILEVGSGRVSRHCADPSVLNVIDVAPSSITNKSAFEAAVGRALNRGRISKFLMPPQDQAYHLEVPQT